MVDGSRPAARFNFFDDDFNPAVGSPNRLGNNVRSNIVPSNVVVHNVTSASSSSQHGCSIPQAAQSCDTGTFDSTHDPRQIGIPSHVISNASNGLNLPPARQIGSPYASLRPMPAVISQAPSSSVTPSRIPIAKRVPVSASRRNVTPRSSVMESPRPKSRLSTASATSTGRVSTNTRVVTRNKAATPIQQTISESRITENRTRRGSTLTSDVASADRTRRDSMNVSSISVSANREAPVKTEVSSEALMSVIKVLACKENCLSNIFDGLKTGQTHVSFFCREYWGTTSVETLRGLEALPFPDKLRKQVTIATNLEQLGLAIVSHQSSGLMETCAPATRSRLRNLVYYLHQNLLILLDLLGSRWEVRNPHSVVNMDLVLRSKGFRSIKRGQHVLTLKTHNDLVINVVKQLCRSHTPTASGKVTAMRGLNPGQGSNPAKDVFQFLGDLLRNASYLEKAKGGVLRQKLLNFLRFEEIEKMVEPDEMDQIFSRYGEEILSGVDANGCVSLSQYPVEQKFVSTFQNIRWHR